VSLMISGFIVMNLFCYAGHRPGDFNNMDIGIIGESGENSNMDSEDLVPSLQVKTFNSAV